MTALLIEDDDEDALLVHKAASKDDCCTLEHRHSVVEAILLLEELRVDVILLDLHLKKSQGFQSLETLMSVVTDIPIVILSGRFDAEASIQAIQHGAQDYISKSDLNSEHLKKTLLYSIERFKLLLALREKQSEIHNLNLKLTSLNRELYDQSIKDPLTQLYNRRFIDENLSLEYKKALRYKFPLYYTLLDIDKFKEINDGAGHEVGDRVLKAIADALKDSTRSSDVVGRFGGDEFVIFGQIDINYVSVFLNRIKAKVAQISVEGLDAQVTLSIGMSVISDKTEKLEKLKEVADQALYKSKESGRNCAHVNCDGKLRRF
jgi:two-component system cell cycle response regulator